MEGNFPPSVRLLFRIQEVLREDFAVLIPGSGQPFNKEALTRLMMYVAFLTFFYYLILYPFFKQKSIQDPPENLDLLEEIRYAPDL